MLERDRDLTLDVQRDGIEYLRLMRVVMVDRRTHHAADEDEPRVGDGADHGHEWRDNRRVVPSWWMTSDAPDSHGRGAGIGELMRIPPEMWAWSM